jgi:hypothetical protein
MAGKPAAFDAPVIFVNRAIAPPLCSRGIVYMDLNHLHVYVSSDKPVGSLEALGYLRGLFDLRLELDNSSID